ncbi:MAG TPA: hypothetical protein ENN85_10640 [Methanoculleus sp.]|nr:hypothetical protein [Methanoculleus sp.]
MPPPSDDETACGGFKRTESQYTILSEKTRQQYRAVLHSFLPFRDTCTCIPLEPRSPATDIARPGWRNHDLPPLDALSLYCFLCLKNPNNYFEIGSGSATRFARQAIRDGHLRTTMTVYDRLTYPGDPANLLADRRRRAPIPVVCGTITAALKPGDILHINVAAVPDRGLSAILDEIIPNLCPGVFVHLSKSLPLGDGVRIPEVILSCADVSRDRDLQRILTPLWSEIGLDENEGRGMSCWVRTV